MRAGTPPVARKIVPYDPALAERLGGIDIANAEQKRVLTALGFGVDDDWAVTVPSWRPDVDGAPDIVEEVIRVHGLDAVPSTPLPRALSWQLCMRPEWPGQTY